MADEKELNLNAQISGLMQDALAACIVTKDGTVAFTFGNDGRITADASDAAKIIGTIGELMEKHQKE